MSYKTIVVHVNESRHGANRVKLAAAIAAEHDAHLIGVATSALPASFYMPGIGTGAAEGLASYLAFAKEGALTALAVFEEFAKQAGVNAIERRLVEDETAGALCLEGRYCDLLIIGQNDPDELLMAHPADMQNYVLTHSPSPVLFIPYASDFKTIGKRIVVAWDGSIEAARAIAGAMPFLQRADIVQIVVFNADQTPQRHGEQPGADIALHIARHGAKVEVSAQTTDANMDIGNALLSHLADFGADLVVMGGFGHSRLRELMLGGVTRTMLATMTVPVLMAH
ncbi:MAG: universal stress protein [Herminiimonas sp.]|nr:universal stress protein [Herminiimonas sp.]